MENSIRLSHYGHASHNWGGVKTEVNGIELQEVRDIHLHCPVDGLPTLTVEQFLTSELDVTVNGIIRPTIIIVDGGFELEVEQISATQTRYRAVRSTK